MKRLFIQPVMVVCGLLALSGTGFAQQPLFSEPVNYGVGDTPYSVFAADLDGDGDADLAVANFVSDNVSILKNNGDGTFAAAVNYGADNGPHSVFAADLDGDSDYDLVVANYFSGIVSILTNNGDGTFAAAVSYEAGGGNSVFAADLDGDSDYDLVVGNEAHYVSILKNNGDGTFAAAVNYGAGDEPRSAFATDLDGDSDYDLAAANYLSDNVSILKNNGDGTFAAAVSYGAGSYPSSVFAADLDGDNDADLAVANYLSTNVSILKNNGNGTFAAAVNYGAGSYPSSVFAADLDGDSYADLAVANRASNNVSILTNYGDGTFAAAVNYGAGSSPWSVFAADLDGDSDYDLAVANYASDNVSILFNLSADLFPTAYIDSITPNPADTGEVVFFGGHGVDADGSIMAYNWRSSIEGQLSDQPSFSTPDLSRGLHTIYFKVQDNDHAWSQEVQINLDILVCLELCGDVDHSGDISLSDVDFLEDYLYNGSPAPVCYNEADVDDYQVVTTNDLIHLREFVTKNSQELTCPPSHSKLSGPVDTANYLRLLNTVFPANQNTVTLHFNFASSVEIHNLVLPIFIRVGYHIPDDIGNIQISPTFSSWSLLTRHATIDSANGKVLFTFGNYPQNSIGPLAETEMATVDISMPSSGVDRNIWVDWAPFPPLDNGEYSHYPMLIEPDETAWKPDLFPVACCNTDGIRGDVNFSGTIGVADVTYLVAYLKQKPPGSPAPPCDDEADVDGSGSINVADVTYLVAYLKGLGPAPPACP
jgi:hypothetical protein